ncbi:MAG: hypothetical protein ACKO86_25475, partial [Dolichospermum sp.]
MTNSSTGVTGKSLSGGAAGEKTKTVSDFHPDHYTIQISPEHPQKIVLDSLALDKEGLIAIQPQLASTLDQLMVRLEQSVNLVEQLASDLTIRDSHSQIVPL